MPDALSYSHLRRNIFASLLLLCLAACATSHVQSAVKPSSPFDDWLAGVRRDAMADGISKQTLDASLGNIQPIQKILDLERNQPEFKITFAQYFARAVTDQRVATGRQMIEEYRLLLDQISASYGVQSRFIVALWGMESDYGRYTGGYPVIGALATLAYGSERKDMFRAELIDALHILDEKNIAPELMTGSWAGAMGQCQFMPSSFQRYAVDFHGDGHRDIWTNQADVFASIANYLKSSGWHAGESWGSEVRLPAGFDRSLIDWKSARPVEEWRRLGMRSLGGGELAPSLPPAGLVAPDGPTGPAYLVYPNFKIIMKWNRSTYFATSVGLLADRLGM